MKTEHDSHFTQLLHNYPLPVALIDIEGRFIATNKALTKIVAGAANAPSSLFDLIPEEGDKLTNFIRHSAVCSEPNTMTFRFQFSLSKSDPKSDSASQPDTGITCSAYAVPTPAGHKSRIVFTLLNHRKQAQSPFSSLNKELDSFRTAYYTSIDKDIKLKQLSNLLINEENQLPITQDVSKEQITDKVIHSMAAGVAHDFNNLLVPILSVVDLLLMNNQGSAEERLHLSIIKEAAEEAKVLTNNILLLDSKEFFPADEVRPYDIVHDNRAALQAVIKPGQSLKIDVENHKHCKIQVNAEHLVQTLVNLIANAAKASFDEGQIELTGQVTPQEEQGEGVSFYTLKVTDHGKGIAADELDNIFLPFYSSETGRKSRGLGLAVVAAITKRHGGKVTVNSTPNQGTTVCTQWPLAARSTPPLGALNDNKSANGHYHIVVIDNEPLIIASVTSVLTSFNYSVKGFLCEVMALEYLKQNPDKVDLVISEHTLQSCDSLALVSKLHSSHRAIPFLIMTSHFNQATKYLLANKKSIDVLFKPFSVTQLKKAVAASLVKSADAPMERDDTN